MLDYEDLIIKWVTQHIKFGLTQSYKYLEYIETK